jgi:CBS domain containing-hemolysin-like protein
MLHIHTLALQGDPTAKLIEKLRGNARGLLGTILLGNVAVITGASAITTVIAIDLFGDASIGIATGVITLLVLVFGEFMPKAYAAHSPEKTAFMFAYPVSIIMTILSPIVILLDRIVAFITPFDDAELKPHVSEEEIKALARLGVKAGTIEKEESELIERALLFSDITAEDVMTPAEKIVYLDGGKTIAEVVGSIANEGFSRYPVWDGSMMNVLGITHLRDIFERITDDPAAALRTVKVKDVAETAMYVAETMKIDDLLRSFQKQRTHMALVVNEYGTIVGLVTIEDLLEELVGEIADETDVDTNIIKRIDKYTVVVHGDVQVSDVNRFLNTRIGEPPNKTISRIILEQLGSLPEQGQTVHIMNDLSAEVLVVSGRHIERVRLTKKPKDSV